jgi:hypothetical protein
MPSPADVVNKIRSATAPIRNSSQPLDPPSLWFWFLVLVLVLVWFGGLFFYHESRAL